MPVSPFFFTRERTPSDDLCSPFDSHQVCGGRKHAMTRGDFFFDFGLGGWVWTAFGDIHERYEPWLSCPWCKERLPEADVLMMDEED
jgi:hypothetical protein